MKQNYNEILREYRIYLTEHEKSHATIQKYVRELVWFLSFLQGEEPTKAKVLEYREQLQQSHHARTVNAKLSAIHSYLDYLGLVRRCQKEKGQPPVSCDACHLHHRNPGQ